MIPPAIALRLPAAVNAGKVIAALSNWIVTFRKLVNDAKFVGKTAPTLVLRKPMSRKFAKVPAKVIAVVPKLLACIQ